MSNGEYLKVSDGTGDAALIHVDADRLSGSATLVPDTLDNVPAKFIAVTGTLGGNGFLDPTKPITVFYGSIDGANINIDSYAAGSTDQGNTEGEVVLLKPNSEWANIVAAYIIRKGTTSTASSSTPTPNADTTSKYFLTALAANATFGAPTGTPEDGQTLLIRIKDNATARTLAWNAVYRALGFALPLTTVISKTMYLGFAYNSAATKWDLIALVQEP